MTLDANQAVPLISEQGFLQMLPYLLAILAAFAFILYLKRHTFFFSIRDAIRFGWEHLPECFGIFFILILLITTTTFGTLVLQHVFEKNGDTTMYLLVSLLNMFFQLFCSLILLRASLDSCEGGKSTIAELLPSFRTYLNYVTSSLLFTFVVILGIVFFIVPGIVIGARMQFHGFLIADRDLGPVDSLRESFQMTRGLTWNLLALNLAMLIILVAGVLAFGVGIIIAVPVVYLAAAYAYCYISDEEEANTPPVPEETVA